MRRGLDMRWLVNLSGHGCRPSHQVIPICELVCCWYTHCDLFLLFCDYDTALLGCSDCPLGRRGLLSLPLVLQLLQKLLQQLLCRLAVKIQTKLLNVC